MVWLSIRALIGDNGGGLNAETQRKQIVKWRIGQGARREPDALAVEEPLEVRVDTKPVCVTMRTPGQDEELAAGFLLSEAIVGGRTDIMRMQSHRRNRQGNVLDVFLAPTVKVDYARLTRHVFASSSCGLCGKATIASVHQQFPPLRRRSNFSVQLVQGLSETLVRGQTAFQQTGGLHAAALFDDKGQLIVLREDVGRHNAVDKVLGWILLQDRLPCQRHALLVSGRASFEIIQKALAAQIPLVAAVSAPTTLAVDLARKSGQTLIGFVRPGRFNVYSHPRGLRWSKRRPSS